LDKKD
jgi:hypothetical protein